jgi:DNA transformation protein and related proteins
VPRLTTAKDDNFVEFICDQLDAWEAVTYKPMFGGYGLYCGVIFFGIVYDGRLYFKTNDASRTKYEAWESAPFQPNAKQTLKSYYEVPVDILENREELSALAEEAVQVASGG